MRHNLLGVCLDFNISNWLIGSALELQQPTTYTTHMSSYTTQPTFDLAKFPNEWIADGGAPADFIGHINDYVSHNAINHKRVKGVNLLAVATGTVKL